MLRFVVWASRGPSQQYDKAAQVRLSMDAVSTNLSVFGLTSSNREGGVPDCLHLVLLIASYFYSLKVYNTFS